MHVGNALSLALGAEAGDKEHFMVVVLAMEKDGLELQGCLKEGRPAHAPARSTAVATDECCVALAVTQASWAGRAGPSVWLAQLISELILDFGDASRRLSLTVAWILDVTRRGPCRQACRRWRGRSTEW